MDNAPSSNINGLEIELSVTSISLLNMKSVSDVMADDILTYQFLQFHLKLAKCTTSLSHHHAFCSEQLNLLKQGQALLPIRHLLLILGITLATKCG
jgi:hypothetical protein